MAQINLNVTDNLELPKEGMVGIGFDTAKKLTAKDDEGNTWEIGGGGGGLVNITYAELIEKMSGNPGGLIPGQQYLLTDFKTTYNIFDGGDCSIIEAAIADDYEPLIITAISTNEIDYTVTSVIYPNDKIYYSPTLLNDGDIGFGDGAGTPVANFKGQIYYRKDTIQNVETHYDFRNVKFRRWTVDAVAYDGGTAYVANDVCKASNGKIYKCITATTGEGDPTVNTADWALWLDITADAFVSWTANKSLFSIGYINPANLIINNVTAGVDYDDFATFGDYYNWVKNVSIGMIDWEYAFQHYFYITQLNNVVFKTANNGYTCFGNNIGSNCWNNTIGAIFSGNTIGYGFSSNTIGNDFNFNTIGNGFSSNTIGYNFSYNTIGNDFSYNTIENNFSSNTIGNGFYNNTIENNFISNTIGYGFSSNTIGNDFNFNTIGNDFNFNTIGNVFVYNTIGIGFNFNTIGNDFNFNTIGYDFNTNTIGNYFSSNTIGDGFSSNTIGIGFNTNAIGNYFSSNTIGNDFNTNTIGNYFSSNTIGDGFSFNTIGNYLYKTIFGDNCQYNTIANKINGTNTNKIITFGDSITMCTIQDFAFGELAADLNLTAATHIRGAYNTTIYYDKTDGVKLSYMDGGVMQIVDVTA